MFFTRNPENGELSTSRSSPDPRYGRVYVLRFTLSCGKIVHKVGMCRSARSTDRLFEITRSFFNVYRYSPQVVMKRDKKVIVPLLVEKHLHNILSEWHYTFDKKFGGSTEFFENIDEEILLDYIDNWDYTELLRSEESMRSSDYEDIVEERAKLIAKSKGTDELRF